jgi:hypothetical protein
VEKYVDFDRNNVRSCDNSNVRKIVVVKNKEKIVKNIVPEEYTTSLE